jgi:hypothetical protein
MGTEICVFLVWENGICVTGNATQKWEWENLNTIIKTVVAEYRTSTFTV